MAVMPWVLGLALMLPSVHVDARRTPISFREDLALRAECTYTDGLMVVAGLISTACDCQSDQTPRRKGESSQDAEILFL